MPRTFCYHQSLSQITFTITLLHTKDRRTAPQKGIIVIIIIESTTHQELEHCLPNNGTAECQTCCFVESQATTRLTRVQSDMLNNCLVARKEKKKQNPSFRWPRKPKLG
jgi:hypothetical protein